MDEIWINVDSAAKQWTEERNNNNSNNNHNNGDEGRECFLLQK